MMKDALLVDSHDCAVGDRATSVTSIHMHLPSKIRPWVYFSACIDAAQKGEVVNVLSRYCIEVDDGGTGNYCGIGLFFSSRFNRSDCELIGRFSSSGRNRVLAVLTSGALSPHDTWRGLAAGACDVLAWREDVLTGKEIAARLQRWQAVEDILISDMVRNRLVGSSSTWRNVLRQVVEVACFTDANTLITGESGTGKELVARLIHTLDTRPDKGEIVVVDCTTIVPELSGSELFGHERGAFTGATNNRDGAFALANGGTLFLDEVGDLPLQLQAQLLRVIQEHTYKRVGGNEWHHTDFRLVCATNRDLRKALRGGQFRSDLYHRIAHWVFTLPSLSQRTDDIIMLAEHFMAAGRPFEEYLQFDETVKEYLLQRDYPGNIRELKQLVCRICQRHVGPGPVTAGDIPEDERPAGHVENNQWRGADFEQTIRYALSKGAQLKEIGRAAEEVAIQLTVENEDGSLQRAAQRLGVTIRTLQLRRAAERRQIWEKFDDADICFAKEIEAPGISKHTNLSNKEDNGRCGRK